MEESGWGRMRELCKDAGGFWGWQMKECEKKGVIKVDVGVMMVLLEGSEECGLVQGEEDGCFEG